MEREVFGVNSGLIVVAHELKAPLALVRQLALSLEFEKNNLSNKFIHSTSEQIVATSERALKQVNDLLKVARLEDALFEMEPVNPRKICDEVIAELWHLFKFNKREVSSNYRNKDKLLIGNKELLYSVIYNFCLNAMNYSGESCPSEVSVYNVNKEKIRVSVRDYGPTIPVKLWREIKSGFVKNPLNIAMRPGSSGLGLYIASKFINYMGGELGITRHRDGTSFYVDLAVSRQLSWLN